MSFKPIRSTPNVQYIKQPEIESSHQFSSPPSLSPELKPGPAQPVLGAGQRVKTPTVISGIPVEDPAAPAAPVATPAPPERTPLNVTPAAPAPQGKPHDYSGHVIPDKSAAAPVATAPVAAPAPEVLGRAQDYQPKDVVYQKTAPVQTLQELFAGVDGSQAAPGLMAAFNAAGAMSANANEGRKTSISDNQNEANNAHANNTATQAALNGGVGAVNADVGRQSMLGNIDAQKASAKYHEGMLGLSKEELGLKKQTEARAEKKDAATLAVQNETNRIKDSAAITGQEVKLAALKAKASTPDPNNPGAQAEAKALLAQEEANLHSARKVYEETHLTPEQRQTAMLGRDAAEQTRFKAELGSAITAYKGRNGGDLPDAASVVAKNPAVTYNHLKELGYTEAQLKPYAQK